MHTMKTVRPHITPHSTIVKNVLTNENTHMHTMKMHGVFAHNAAEYYSNQLFNQ